MNLRLPLSLTVGALLVGLVALAPSALVPSGLAPSAQAQEGAAKQFSIDNSHTHVGFKVQHLGVSYTYGRFNTVSGSFAVDAQGNPQKVMVEIDAASVDSNDPKRDQHLRGPDFFNVKQFPKITFAQTSLKPGEKPGELAVTGRLTLHGVTQEVTLTMRKVGEGADPWGGYRSGFDGVVTLKRSDYGIAFMPQGIGDDVMLSIGVEGVEQK